MMMSHDDGNTTQAHHHSESDSSSSSSMLNICSNSKEAAQAIRDYSFAIVKVSPDTALALERAKVAARQFLQQAASSDEKDKYIQKYRVISNGNLFGYNVPSSAKVLFRAICSELGLQQMGEWPNEELKLASINVATELHTLLMECYDEIINLSSSETTAGPAVAGQRQAKKKEGNERMTMMGQSEDTCLAKSPPSTITSTTKRRHTTDTGHENDNHKHKRASLTSSVSAKKEDHQSERQPSATTKTQQHDDKTMVLNRSPASSCSPLSLSRTLQEAQYCPLDYFLYHGYRGKAATNCSEHKDRGVLICVALSDVPGLEVLPRNCQQFVCPEEEVEKLLEQQEEKEEESLSLPTINNNNNSNNLVCIMVGDQLIQFLPKYHDHHDEDSRWSACIHRVKKQLKGPRLSITYELRANNIGI